MDIKGREEKLLQILGKAMNKFKQKSRSLRIRRLLCKNRYRNDEEEMNIILRTVCGVVQWLFVVKTSLCPQPQYSSSRERGNPFIKIGRRLAQVAKNIF